jgi:hypothetical protein
MEVHYPTLDQPAAPEYVLAVLQDMHRQQCQWDPEADKDAILSMATTVAEWRAGCDLVGWKLLGHAHNEIWGVQITDADWQAVLEPAHERQLADVCKLIAARANRRVIRPARLFDCNCASAGVFLTIRSLLHEAGEEAAGEIAPSTPLAPYLRRYADVFLGPISRLAPGALPPVRIRTPVYDGALLGSGVGWLAALIGACAGLWWLVAAGAVLFGLGYALTWYASRCLLPASVGFGDLRTFRDLAVVVTVRHFEDRAWPFT